MDIFLYTCPDCHCWQPVSAFQVAAKQFANALNSWAAPSSSQSKPQDPLIVACPSGCGLMTQVQPEDKLQIMPAIVEKEVESNG
jgi:hypothetical protein